MKKALAVMMTISILLSTVGISYADMGMKIRPVEDHLKAVEKGLEKVIDDSRKKVRKLRESRQEPKEPERLVFSESEEKSGNGWKWAALAALIVGVAAAAGGGGGGGGDSGSVSISW